MSDTRIRFGFCDSLDLDPQIITEYPQTDDDILVAVIPLPSKHVPPGYQLASDQ